jgi:hypothetical protein
MSRPARPATYGDLMRAARRHVADGAVAAAQQRILDPAAAQDAIASYRTLLAMFHHHARVLAGGPRRASGVRASTNASQFDLAAMQLVDAFAAARIHPRPGTGVNVGADAAVAGRAWTRATECIGAAGDLLSTHRDIEGGWRSPDAAHLEASAVQIAGMLDLATLTDCVLAGQRDLALRSGQAGIPWREVARLLPELDELRTSTRRVLAVGDADPAGRRLLEDFSVARPTIRAGEPLTELGDRILRLRRTAWQLQRDPRVGVASLTDVAAGAVIFHTYVVHMEQAALPRGGLAGHAGTARAAWSLAHLHLRELRTATPGLAIVRDDVLGIRDACRRLMGEADGRSLASVPVSGARERATMLAGGLRSFRDIAGSVADRLDHLSNSGQIYISGRRLTGEQVTDCPDLVTAKLEGTLVVAPREQAEPALDALQTARGRSGWSERNRAHESDRRVVISP